MALREQLQGDVRQRSTASSSASCRSSSRPPSTALKAFPRSTPRSDGDDIVYKHYYDIGVAVGGGKGLVVPVLRDADSLGFAEIEKAIADLGAPARDNKLTLDDLQGGTFTITNGGIYGSMLSTPILNPPQTGILGMHNIVERPVVRRRPGRRSAR